MGVAPLDDAVEIEHGGSGVGSQVRRHGFVGSIARFRARYQSLWRGEGPLILQAFSGRRIVAILCLLSGEIFRAPLKLLAFFYRLPCMSPADLRIRRERIVEVTRRAVLRAPCSAYGGASV
jgi:hypothetical protein